MKAILKSAGTAKQLIGKFIVLSLMLGVLMAQVSAEEGTLREATLIDYSGDVVFKRAGGEEPIEVFEGVTFSEGDQIITGTNAWAEIEIEETAEIKLSERSKVYISELIEYAEEEVEESFFSLFSGGFFGSIKETLTTGSRFEVETDTAIMGVRGTDYYVSRREEETEVSVITGSITVDPREEVVAEPAPEEEPEEIVDPEEPEEVPEEPEEPVVDEAFEIEAGEHATIEEAPDGTVETETERLSQEDLELEALEATKEIAEEDPEEVPEELQEDIDEAIGEKRQEREERREEEEEAIEEEEPEIIPAEEVEEAEEEPDEEDPEEDPDEDDPEEEDPDEEDSDPTPTPDPDMYDVSLTTLTGEGEVEVDVSWNGEEETLDSETDSVEVEDDTEVTIEADAEEGWEFDSWSEDADGETEESFDVTINEDYDIGVEFIEEGILDVTNFDAPENVEENETFSVTADIQNTGDTELTQDVEFNVDGVEEETDEDVTVSGDDTESVSFDYFHDTADDITVEIATDDAEESDTVTVVPETYDVSLTTLKGEGDITVNGDTLENETDSVDVEEGTEVTIEAVADEGWEFDSWSEDADGEDESFDVTIEEDYDIGVEFTEDPEEHTVSLDSLTGDGDVEADIGENGTVDETLESETDSFTVEDGTDVEFSAVGEGDYEFEDWTEDASGEADTTFTVTIDSDYDIGVEFAEKASFDNGEYKIDEEDYGILKFENETIDDDHKVQFTGNYEVEELIFEEFTLNDELKIKTEDNDNDNDNDDNDNDNNDIMGEISDEIKFDDLKDVDDDAEIEVNDVFLTGDIKFDNTDYDDWGGDLDIDIDIDLNDSDYDKNEIEGNIIFVDDDEEHKISIGDEEDEEDFDDFDGLEDDEIEIEIEIEDD